MYLSELGDLLSLEGTTPSLRVKVNDSTLCYGFGSYHWRCSLLSLGAVGSSSQWWSLVHNFRLYTTSTTCYKAILWESVTISIYSSLNLTFIFVSLRLKLWGWAYTVHWLVCTDIIKDLYPVIVFVSIVMGNTCPFSSDHLIEVVTWYL